MPKETSSVCLLEVRPVSDTVLTDWDEELVAVDRGSSKARVEKDVGSPSEGSTEPGSGTKDPTKSLKRDAQLQKKDAKALRIDSDVTKTGQTPAVLRREKARQKSDVAPHSSVCSLMPKFKQFKHKGSSRLGELLKVKKDATCDDNTSAIFD